MALFLVQFDDATGKTKKGPQGAPVSLVDESFDTVASQSSFSVVEDFSATQVLDVYVDGTLQREGASNDYTRDAVANTIGFATAVQSGSWVLVRVWPE